ncbi:MAG: hypothetical protein H6748_18820 [Spirochaetaceae bacterium]|nr:hypothetical protein [Spirochaetaceae bacterium]
MTLVMTGTGDASRLAEGAPVVEALAREPLALPGCVFVQALTEIESGPMCEMLPPALHPTLPPVVGFTVWDAPDSVWGPFRLAQLRIECRSGLRPRGLLVSAVVDQPEAAAGLASRFGFRVTTGEVVLDRGYDATRIRVATAGKAGLFEAVLRAPQRLGESDTQFVSSLHPARMPRGLRLVQVDVDHAVKRAERTRFGIEHFDAAGWGEARIRPSLALPAVVGVADVTLRPIRYVCRPDVLAFEGTEAVDASAA